MKVAKKKPTTMIWDPVFCDLIYKMRLLGATEQKIYEMLNISETCWLNWKAKNPEIKKTLRKGKEEADANVAHSLYKRAIGYTTEAVKVFYDAKTGEEKVVRYEEQVQPDVNACNIWLKNRQRENWYEKVENHTQIDAGLTIKIQRFCELENGDNSTLQMEAKAISA